QPHAPLALFVALFDWRPLKSGPSLANDQSLFHVFSAICLEKSVDSGKVEFAWNRGGARRQRNPGAAEAGPNRGWAVLT
ncbi:MAG TPA: hypothetical protein VHR66_04980, partial [Gemmataceae bacterium]|nr:hypothetical protein [Gemmataceae bacterium]